MRRSWPGGDESNDYDPVEYRITHVSIYGRGGGLRSERARDTATTENINGSGSGQPEQIENHILAYRISFYRIWDPRSLLTYHLHLWFTLAGRTHLRAIHPSPSVYMVTHHRLENALARAEELIAVGNQSVALQLLHDAIVSRWFQHNLLALDAIMLKFVELCVELRRGRLAKDGLHQYRNLSQTANVAGLEAVMTHFLDGAEAKLEAAYKEAADATSLEAVEDLEQASEDALSTLWISASDGGSAENSAERTGRALVTPWLRFVWETFRIILDICRHNAKLEPLYRTVVERAFAFCRRYGRKAELRRLCEILRHHLTIIVRYPGQANGVQLREPASHALQLELRFKQLDAATNMELWHEAFRSIEDIHGLFVLARKSAQPALVLTYYARLCRVFQMAGKHLYLAATLCKLLALSAKSENKQRDRQADASLAVLALLATPRVQEVDVTCTMAADELAAKDTRLAALLGLAKVPTRLSIGRELQTKGILAQATSAVQSLYTILEGDDALISDRVDGGDSLLISNKRTQVEELLSNVLPSAPALIPSIHRNYVAIVCAQVSRRQKEVSIAELSSMISMPQLESVRTFSLDSFLLEGNRSGDFHVRLDQLHKRVIFNKPCFAPVPTLAINDPERCKLTELYRLLAELGIAAAASPTIPEEQVDALIRSSYAHLASEHQANLLRKGRIEKRKEQLEELQQRREREEARERALRLAAEKEAEQKRMVEDASRRELQRREVEKEAIRREQATRREEEEQRKREAQVRRANLERMIAVVKRLDHLERAYRQEEQPLLAADYERQKAVDLAAYEERTRLLRERAQIQHTTDVQMKGRLAAMTNDYEEYRHRLGRRRIVEFEALRERRQEELAQAKLAYRERLLAQAQREREEHDRIIAEQERKAQEEEAAEAAAAAEEKKATYVPPSRRAMTSSAPAPEARSSPFGTRSSAFGSSSPTTASGTASSGVFGGGSWRRQ